MFKVGNDICVLQHFSHVESLSNEYYSWLTDYEVIKYLNLPEYLAPISRSSVANYVEKILNSDSDIFLAIYAKTSDIDQKFIGTLKIGHINSHSRSADLGLMIGDKNFWGKGIATAAISIAVEYAFFRLGLNRVSAGAMAVNKAVIACFEKNGFRREGCARQQDYFEGAYEDHVFLGCLRDDFVPQH